MDSVGLIYVGDNTNLFLADNMFNCISDCDEFDDDFQFFGAGNTQLPGSTGNVVTTAPMAGVIRCFQREDYHFPMMLRNTPPSL